MNATNSQRLEKEEPEGPHLQLQRPSNPFILEWLHLQQLQHHLQLQSLSFLLVPSQHSSVFFEMGTITIGTCLPHVMKYKIISKGVMTSNSKLEQEEFCFYSSARITPFPSCTSFSAVMIASHDNHNTLTRSQGPNLCPILFEPNFHLKRIKGWKSRGIVGNLTPI